MDARLGEFERVAKAATVLAERIAPHRPQIGVVLGSGLGSFADALEQPRAVAYAELPGFATSSVAGHAGQLVAGRCGGRPVLVMSGRVHAYEGHDLATVVLPTRVLCAVGCHIIVLTNAAGAINSDFDPGDLVVISDHINMTGLNPLVGPEAARFGPRFVDLTRVYDPELRALAHQQGRAESLKVKEGVYCWMLGPSYETPAEVRMLRTLGADLCGMSTVPEAIVANQAGARVLGISCVTNKAAGLGQKLTHEDVQETAAAARPRFIALLSRICAAVELRTA